MSRTFTPKSRAGLRRGFTLIELLVVVLILAVLMAVAVPLYLQSVADSQRKTCRANMQTIANAVQAAYVRTGSPYSGYASFAGPVTTANEPDLQAVPVCPANGTYSIVVGGPGVLANNGVPVPANSFEVKCSYGNHGVFAPGIDSQ